MKWKTLCSSAALVTLIFAGSVASQDSQLENLKLLTDLMTRPLAQRALQWVCVPSVRYVGTQHVAIVAICRQVIPLVSYRVPDVVAIKNLVC